MTNTLVTVSGWLERRSRAVAIVLGALAIVSGGALLVVAGWPEAIAAVVILGGPALALVAPLAAWGVYLAFTLLGGVALELGPVLVRFELIGVPMLAAALWRWSAGRQRVSAWILATGGVWLALTLVGSIAIAPEPARSVWIWIQQLGGFAVFLLVARVRRDRRPLFHVAAAVMGAVVLLSIGIFVFFPEIQPGADLVEPRLAGLAIEPNLLAAQCVGWLAVSYYFRAWRARWHLAVDAVVVVGLVLAGTRAAWIAAGVLAVFVAATWLRGRGASRTRTAVTLGVAGAVVAGGGFAVLSAIGSASVLVERALSLLDFSGGTAGYRLLIYSDAVRELAEPWRWVIGSGANSFSQFHPVDPTNVGAAYLSTVWLAIPYDAGVLGAIAFFAMIVLMWLGTARRAESAALFVAILICATATNSFWLAFPWLFFALVHDRADRAGAVTSDGSTVAETGADDPVPAPRDA